jgi:NhaA family Na+:H+ antiporter
MQQKIQKVTANATSKILTLHGTLRLLLRDETIAGKLILVFAALAILVVNLPTREIYEAFWHINISLGIGDFSIEQDLRHWVNEALMAIFFLVVGLEIKREIVSGELSDTQKAILPMVAAIGGMIFPALIYLLLNTGTDTIQGWGIPIATDIAFAVAILSLLGKHVPLSLKLFLLALAIVDDIGAIFIIALFYADIINYWFLLGSFSIVAILWFFRTWLTPRLGLVVLLGILLWFTAHLAGIHASIVGAILGLLAPINKINLDKTPAKKLEEFFLPISTFIVLPIFAFANAGIILTASALTQPETAPMITGIILGLVCGKLLGITFATWLMVKFKFAQLPTGTNWTHIVGVSLIAGIGFTVSIFVTDLAFENELLSQTAKISVFIGSGIAALAGSLVLRTAKEISK